MWYGTDRRRISLTILEYREYRSIEYFLCQLHATARPLHPKADSE